MVVANGSAVSVSVSYVSAVAADDKRRALSRSGAARERPHLPVGLLSGRSHYWVVSARAEDCCDPVYDSATVHILAKLPQAPRSMSGTV